MSTTTDTEAEPTPLFNNTDVRLMIHRDPNGQTMTRTSVSWRISPELEAKLAELGDTDPHILIVVAHHEQEITRYVFPLRDKKAHISFHYSGPNLVYATVVSSKGSKKSPADYLMARQGGTYTVAVTRQVDDVLEELRAQRKALYDEVAVCDTSITLLKEKLQQITPVPDLAGDASVDDIHRRELLVQIAEAQTALMALEGQSVEAARLEIDRRKAQKAAAEEQIVAVDQSMIEREAHAQYHLEPCDTYWERHPPASRISGVSVVEVDISKQFFARTWRITKWLAARLPWPTKALNGCLIRARAMTGALKSIPALFGAILFSLLNALILAFRLLCGCYEMPYRALWHPFTLNPRELIIDSEWHSRWFSKREPAPETWTAEYQYLSQPIYRCFLNPLIAFGGAMVGLVIFAMSGWQGWIIVGGLMFIPLTLLALAFPVLAKGPFARIGKAFDAWSDRRFEKEQRKLLADLERLARAGNARAEVPLLPSDHRLRYVLTAGKNLVCKSVEGTL